MTAPIRWGLLGTGKIAGKFADAINLLPDAVVHAVASRREERAEAFAAAYGAERGHGSYEALVADPEVDVVYVATPHARHRADTLLALEAGKAVLCEKPLALNGEESADMVRAARERGLFLMEAMWMYFIPAVVEARRRIAAGEIGEVRLLSADFGFRLPFDASHRAYDPALGGGSLLDIGIYPLALAAALWGEPEAVAGHAHVGTTGVDEQAAGVLSYPGGRLATFHSTFQVETPTEAVFVGREGRLTLHHRFHHAAAFTVSRPGRADERVEIPFEGNGMQFEAAHVGRCLRDGRTESDVMPLDASLALARTMDAFRAQWGVRYPGET